MKTRNDPFVGDDPETMRKRAAWRRDLASTCTGIVPRFSRPSETRSGAPMCDTCDTSIYMAGGVWYHSVLRSA